MDHCMKVLYLAVPAYGLYAICSSLYETYRRSSSVVFESRRSLPCYLYLYVRHKIQALRKRRGRLYSAGEKAANPTFTILNCRLRGDEQRWYCWATGYGWDYPDSVFRDIPPGFCHVLYCRLLPMITSSRDFRLSPQGLVHVRQIIRKYEPTDELKKAPFRLQAAVTEYRPVDSGVEVDICFSAGRAEQQQPVWESVVTLLSPRQEPGIQNQQPCPTGPDGSPDVKSVAVRLPLLTGLRSAWAFSDISLKNILVFPARQAIVGRSSTHSLWMMSQCLAEIEKHKGPDAVRSPLRVTVQFVQPLVLPRRTAAIRFWEDSREDVDNPDSPESSKHVRYSFQLLDKDRGTCYLTGELVRESN